jgi:hypothetical protein
MKSIAGAVSGKRPGSVSGELAAGTREILGIWADDGGEGAGGNVPQRRMQ